MRIRQSVLSGLTIFLYVLLSVLLSACGSDNSNEPESPAPVASATIETHVLLIWHSFQGVENDALAQIRADFEVKYPNVDVQLEFVNPSTLRDSFANAVTEGGGPDLIFGPLDWIPDLAARGVIQPIRQAYYDKVFSMLAESVAHTTFYQASPYGVPFASDFPTFYYNRALMLTPPDTFSALMEEAANHGLLIPPTFSATSVIYLSLDDQFAERVTLDPTSLEAFLVELQTLANSPGVIFTADQNPFLQGEAGLLMAPSSDYPALLDALGDDLGVIRYPTDREWRGFSTIWPVMQSINSTTEALDTGELFLSFLLSPPAQRTWFEQTHHAPVNVAALENDMQRVAWSYMLAQSIPAPVEFLTRAASLLDQAVQSVTLEGADPATTAESLMAALQ